MPRDKYNPGRYGGSRVGYLEHEVENYIRQRLRFGTSEPVAEPVPVPDHLVVLSVKEVERRLGYSRVHLWRLERAGKFPRRIRLVDPPGGEADAA